MDDALIVLFDEVVTMRRLFRAAHSHEPIMGTVSNGLFRVFVSVLHAHVTPKDNRVDVEFSVEGIGNGEYRGTKTFSAKERVYGTWIKVEFFSYI